uniref:Uncharacterized protein n=1 Tax=Timema bartmani TaxID=61472 RepID=A0A7R9ENY3_9NEOP|nr:unnamed protein product [Timema bartmani]
MGKTAPLVEQEQSVTAPPLDLQKLVQFMEWVTIGAGQFMKWVTIVAGQFKIWVIIGDGQFMKWVMIGDGEFMKWVTIGDGKLMKWVMIGDGKFMKWKSAVNCQSASKKPWGYCTIHREKHQCSTRKATELYLTTLNDNIGLTKGDNKTTADVIPSNKDPSRWQENPVRKTPPNLMQDDPEKPSQENRNKPAVQINQTDPLSVGPVQSPQTAPEKTAMGGEAKEQIQKGSLYEPGNVLKVNDADITKDITFKVPGLETKSGEAEELPLNLQNNEEDNLSIGDYNQGETPMDSDTDMSGADEHTDINDRVNVESEPDVPPAQNLEERQTGKMPAEGPDDTAYNRGGAFSEDEDSHFFAYFMTMVLICIIGYLVFHNKQKGRSRKGSRRRPNTAGYRKLDSNLEEAVTSSCSQSVTHVIY